MAPRAAFAATTVNVECDAGQNQNPFRWQAEAIKKDFGIELI